MFKILLLSLILSAEEDTIPLPIKDPVEEARDEMDRAFSKIKESDIKKAQEHQKKVVEALDNAIKLNQNNDDQPPDGGKGKSQKKSSSSKGMSKITKRSSMSKLAKSAGGNNPKSGVSGPAGFDPTYKDRLKMEAKIWGSLNKKEENEQKVSLLKEEFLPIYSSDIEAYYKEISDTKRLSK